MNKIVQINELASKKEADTTKRRGIRRETRASKKLRPKTKNQCRGGGGAGQNQKNSDPAAQRVPKRTNRSTRARKHLISNLRPEMDEEIHGAHG